MFVRNWTKYLLFVDDYSKMFTFYDFEDAIEKAKSCLKEGCFEVIIDQEGISKYGNPCYKNLVSYRVKTNLDSGAAV